MRTAIQNHLNDLEKDLINMADMVITAVNSSITALKKRDIDQAKRIRKNDKNINDKRWEIEEKCINIIATQQPVATDLRELIAVLNIITDLERIADYAAGISKIVIKLGNGSHVKPLIDIPRMADISIQMIEKSLKAYAEQDDKAARKIHKQDDDVDDLYNQVYRELVSIMIEKPSTITSCTYLLWVSHNLERIGDRVTNICERIIFLVTGEMVEDVS